MIRTAPPIIDIQTWNNQSPELTALVALQQLHWSIIPLDSDKRPVKTGGNFPDGNPKRLKWKPYQERQASEQEIRTWQKKYTPPAWGVVTGFISGTIVLDFDGEKGKATLERLGLSPHRQTGSGGLHVDFKHPGWHVPTLNSKTKEELGRRWPGLDIRADGGYAAFCGSNASGPYQWLREPILEDLSILPEDLRDFLGLLYPPEEKPMQQTDYPIRRSGSPISIPDRLLDKALDRIGYDGRDNACFWLACQLRDNDVPRSQAESQVCDFARRCPPTNTKGQPEPFTERDALVKLDSAYSRPAREAWKSNDMQEFRASRHTVAASSNGNGNHSNNGHRAATDEIDPKFVVECLKQNEWGDSLLFAQLFRGEAIYDHTEKVWYLWHHHYWKRDDVGRVKSLVSGVLANIYIDAMKPLNIQLTGLNVPAATDEQKVQASQLQKTISALYSRAVDLRSIARCKNVLSFASSQEGMGLIANQWDRNKWTLALPNGVLNLRTGKCEKGNPEDYIRTIAPTEWQGPDAPAPRFEQALDEMFADRPDPERRELIGFFHRLMGYGITGEVSEHIFAVLFGEDGRNGKDTLQHIFTYVLGEASGAISKDVLLDMGKQHAAGGATPHLCDLHGKRVAWASEPEKGAHFNVGQVKELSGGGEIRVRPLYAKDYYSIKPTHLLILLTNHKPRADANDSAFWSRLRLITFNQRFLDNPDPNKKNEHKADTMLWPVLESEASGILAWLVRGCLEWQEHGLSTPQSVIDAGNLYRKEEDVIGQFIEERCDTSDPKAKTLASRLYTAYSNWCDIGNRKAKMNSTNFGRLLSKRFTKDEKPTRIGSNQGIHYHGIKILPSPDGDESVKGFWISQKTLTLAAEADLGDQNADEREQCEVFSQEIPNYSIETPIEKLLYEKTIHTVHKEALGSDTKPLVETDQETVNSSKNPSQLQKDMRVNTPAGSGVVTHVAASGDQVTVRLDSTSKAKTFYKDEDTTRIVPLPVEVQA